jgi:mannose-6-phosphate isomerase-like protein (cupin superfamily)
MKPIILAADEGRSYEMGAIRAVFKADGGETGDRFSVSEWWLDPRHEGPGAHQHDDNDELFYVLAGEASILVGESWHKVGKGGFVFIPRGVMHDFRNESAGRIGLFNVFLPGPFEQAMPQIAKWFAEHPAKPI